VYGLDSHGLLCGSNNTYKGSVMDLTDKPNLYYLEALELLDPTNLMYARAVCVSECPSTEELCSLSNLPCTNNTQYRCAGRLLDCLVVNGTKVTWHPGRVCACCAG
jgi:choline transporter-like protein 2/4/5